LPSCAKLMNIYFDFSEFFDNLSWRFTEETIDTNLKTIHVVHNYDARAKVPLIQCARI